MLPSNDGDLECAVFVLVTIPMNSLAGRAPGDLGEVFPGGMDPTSVAVSTQPQPRVHL